MYPIFTLLMFFRQYPDEFPIIIISRISIPINLVMVNEDWYSYFMGMVSTWFLILWVDPQILHLPPKNLAKTQDDAQGNLSSAAKNALKTCGATLIDSISYRGSYALIGHMEDVGSWMCFRSKNWAKRDSSAAHIGELYAVNLIDNRLLYI